MGKGDQWEISKVPEIFIPHYLSNQYSGEKERSFDNKNTEKSIKNSSKEERSNSDLSNDEENKK